MNSGGGGRCGRRWCQRRRAEGSLGASAPAARTSQPPPIFSQRPCSFPASFLGCWHHHPVGGIPRDICPVVARVVMHVRMVESLQSRSPSHSPSHHRVAVRAAVRVTYARNPCRQVRVVESWRPRRGSRGQRLVPRPSRGVM